jgi:hypothetical protein
MPEYVGFGRVGDVAGSIVVSCWYKIQRYHRVLKSVATNRWHRLLLVYKLVKTKLT